MIDPMIGEKQRSVRASLSTSAWRRRWSLGRRRVDLYCSIASGYQKPQRLVLKGHVSSAAGRAAGQRMTSCRLKRSASFPKLQGRLNEPVQQSLVSSPHNVVLATT